MQRFINPEELNTLLDTHNGPLLLIFLNKIESFSGQQQTLEELFNLFDKKLEIAFMDIEYQNSVSEKFAVHGFPAFIFCKQGKKKDVLLGTPESGVLSAFVVKNLSQS
jgi:thioredoxin-like negative regulator of GroEL